MAELEPVPPLEELGVLGVLGAASLQGLPRMLREIMVPGKLEDHGEPKVPRVFGQEAMQNREATKATWGGTLDSPPKIKNPSKIKTSLEHHEERVCVSMYP